MTTKIYTLTDPDSLQVRYVGKSNNPQKRYFKHCVISKIKTHKNHWINKLLSENKKPILDVIDEVPIDNWIFWERYWIAQFRAWGFNLTNLTDGGDGCLYGNRTSFKKGHKSWNEGITHSDVTKEKLRKINLGKIQSQVTKDKRSKALSGRPCSNLDDFLIAGKKTRFTKDFSPWNKGKKGHKLGGLRKAKPVEQLSLDGLVITEYSSYVEAAKAIDGNAEGIRKCCVGKNKKSKGFNWRYKTI